MNIIIEQKLNYMNKTYKIYLNVSMRILFFLRTTCNIYNVETVE